MEIEVVEFYQEKRDDAKQTLRGSLHVYLTNLQVDLRGIRVVKEKKFWQFRLPSAKGIEEETKEIVWFPVFSFMDRAKTSEFLATVREKGIAYIKENVLKQLPNEESCQKK